MVGLVDVGALADVNLGVLVSFAVVVFAYDAFGAVHHVGCHLIAFDEANLGDDVFTLALLYAVYVYL